MAHFETMIDLQKHRPTDRVPPNSTEAESGVLGCILWDAKQCLNECVVRFGQDEVWYDLRHQVIFQAMTDLADAMKPVEVVSVMQHLKDAGTLEQIGGIAYLSSLQDAVPSAANLSY
ncbi:MAG: hypothetical protein RLY20_2903, partial [Verrucomicrobiota bacterium]